jgi:hypothetical protein
MLRCREETTKRLGVSLSPGGSHASPLRNAPRAVRSSPPSGSAAWARCTKPATPAWTARSPSRFSRPRSAATLTVAPAFEHEAKTLAGPSRPHICSLFDVGERDGSMDLAMEHLAGATLADRLHKAVSGAADALRWAREATSVGTLAG